MDCKKYYNTFWARLAIILFLTGICAWLITESNWLWLCIAVPTLAWSVGSFYRLYTYHTRKVAFLLDAIENNDPAVHFYEHVVENAFDGLTYLLARFFKRDNSFYACVDAVCSLDLTALQSDSVSVSVSDHNYYTLSFKTEGGDGE